MIGLADLAHPETRSWTEAESAFVWPAISEYNIAADCLRSNPAKTAVIAIDGDTKKQVTYGELNERSARFGAGLGRLKVAPGDRVAVKLPQSIDMAVAVLGILRIGAIVVPISNVLGEDALVHRLADSAPKVLISSGSRPEVDFARKAGAIPITTEARDDIQSMEELMAGPQPAGGFLPTRPDTPGLLLYTSGTTGKSKGVLHGHRVLLGHHATDLALDHVREDDVAYSPVDWAWAGGLLLGLLVPLARGMTVVAYRGTRLDPERTIEIMRECGVSVGLFPPTALRMLYRSGKLTPAVAATLRLRSLILGAEAVEPELADWARGELGISVNNAFGQTEANALIGHSDVLGALDRDCLGRAYPGHTIAILDPDLHECAPGVAGEIAVSTTDPVCMLRYWNNPEATEKKIRGGWLLTGDVGHTDDRHQIYFHGRADDLIKSGGYRIGPAEVEAAILLNPVVAECAVIGIPDPVRGQVVTAYAQLVDGENGSDALTQALQYQVRKKVGAHAYPRTVLYVTSLPRTTTGKVDRNALRKAFSERSETEAAR
ncbi:AMP-binding protein [Parafrigoribacterium mesophilum]|uniref:acyl-CoA synthetase n=1 Tax=Parafrigoribacterium mesophilum TaxID=433646 RepID=UPI0031FD677D